MITIIIILVLIVIIGVLAVRYSRLRSLYESLRSEFERRVAEQAQKLAQELYSRWVSSEADRIRREATELAYRQAKVELKEREVEIRRDAIKRSIMTILGKIAEHIAPLIIMKKLGINPKDLRFLGTPIDYIAFKGLSDGNPQEIVFIEVKAGKTSSLTPRERAVKKLVEEKKVRWITLSLQEELEHIGKIIEEEIEKAAKQEQ